jgi:uncharacterized protein YjbI with pentapeptide repeats
MAQCNLRAASFTKVDFGHAYNPKLVRTPATIRQSNLELAELAEGHLNDSNLTSSRLREVDVRGADLSDAILRDCIFFLIALASDVQPEPK